MGWYAIARIGDARVVSKLEAEIAKRGEPLGLAELARAYSPVPDEENAATALIEVWEKEDPARWSAFRQQKRALPGASEVKFDPALPYLGKTKFIAGQQLTDVSRQAVNRFLSERAAHIAAVRAAIQRPRSRFPIALEDGAVMLLPQADTESRSVVGIGFEVTPTLLPSFPSCTLAMRCLSNCNCSYLANRERFGIAAGHHFSPHSAVRYLKAA